MFRLSTMPQSTNASQIPVKTAGRITKIRDLLDRALGEVQNDRKLTSSTSPGKKQSDQSSESESIQQILANLKKGYLMIKHSENTSEPHDKFVYLSKDERFLCWKSIDKENEKRMEITNIEKVVTEGSQYLIKDSKINEINRCFVIVSEEKNLQLEAMTDCDSQYFKYELNRVIMYWKGMRLNYKYNKKY